MEQQIIISVTSSFLHRYFLLGKFLAAFGPDNVVPMGKIHIHRRVTHHIAVYHHLIAVLVGLDGNHPSKFEDHFLPVDAILPDIDLFRNAYPIAHHLDGMIAET